MKNKIIKSIQKFFHWLLITLPTRIKKSKFTSTADQPLVDKIKKHKRYIISAIILLAIGYAIYARIQYNRANPYAIWEVLVVLRSQESGGAPEEDAKTSLKRGDVIAVRETKHAWSETEYKSYLLVKIEGRKQEVAKLLEPLMGDPKVQPSDNPKVEPSDTQETIRARKYAVDMDKVGFSGDQVIKGQPVEGKVFKTDVIKEK